MENCTFCLEPNIVLCMNRSLQHKYNQDYDKNGITIDDILDNEKSESSHKYKELMLKNDCGEYLKQFSSFKISNAKYFQLIEYYKYRMFVPLFAKSSAADTALSYYYDKLKHHYNTIKRKLHITIDPSSMSNTYTVNNVSEDTQINLKGQFLKDFQITTQYENDNKKQIEASIRAYKTQSKALQQLMSYLKFKGNFQHIKSLKTEDCFDDGYLYSKNFEKRKLLNIIPLKDSFKVTLKSKLLKKITQNSNGKKTPIPVQRQKSPEQAQLKSKSIKIMHSNSKIPERLSKQTKYKIKQVQLKLSQSRSANNISKRNSLTKINPNQYSPYKKKSGSSDKHKETKISETTQNLRNKSIQAIRINNNDELLKIKETILKFQVLKFQNQSSHKTGPISPSTKIKPRKSIEVTKNDNILTIRKKKLEALKEQLSKR